MFALVLALAVTHASDPGSTYNGRDRNLDVQLPRIEAAVTIDGALSEPAWTQASVLTGFSQFQPVDGRAATDSTRVLVWYSPTAIHFGIRAYEAHGLVNANLLDRDKIFSDDNIQILLGTFNDGRQAMVFAVNPFGIQADGTLNEGTGSRGGSAFGGGQSAREQADLSANFVFESKGRTTDYGYEVEIRIPFKSLRYQSRDIQDWGVNVVRQVQHLGQEDSWAPASRAAASFLGQSGKLVGLKELRRGLVVDVIPEIVTRSSGSENDVGKWNYDGDAQVGGNVRWGITNNLTFNGTVNPDFAQVEADVAAIQYDPRAAVSYPERRPFFLEGIENFSTPSNLVYTRRVVQPDAAAKFTGKVAGTNIAALSAVDDRTTSLDYADPDTRPNAERPIYNILRTTRDLGGSSRIGFVYTDKVDGRYYNRVAGLDGRFVFNKIYTIRGQVAGSATRRNDITTHAPLWNASFDRQGRNVWITYSVSGTDPDFRAASGFLSRVGIANANFNNRYTVYGKPGSLIQSSQFAANQLFTWQYDRFTGGNSWQDGKLHFTNNTTFKGGWRAGMSLLLERFGFDDNLYSGYRLLKPNAVAGFDTIPFTGVGRLDNVDWVFSAGTPQFKRFSGDVLFIVGQDENFYEWSSANIVTATVNASWRPVDKLRIDGQYQHLEYNRKTDGSTVGIRKIPRLKVEYQIARPMFFRMVGQYDAEQQGALYDDSRTGYAIARPLPTPTGIKTIRDPGFSRNDLRVDWLFSYQPTPGTVMFAGYGSSYDGPEHLRFRELERTQDGFFVKMSYLFRL